MRLYLYLILMIMFSITSCKVTKYKQIMQLDDEIYQDSTFYEDLYEEETIFDHIYAPAPAPAPPRYNDNNRNEYNRNTQTKQKDLNKVVNDIIIVNNIDSLKLESGNGIIIYQIPEKLTYGETYIFKLRISSKYKISIENLLVNNKNIPLTTNPHIGPIILEDIKTSEYMSANLWADPNGFEISSLNTIRQKINNESFTEWSWKVKPIKSGEFYIKLTINIDDIDYSVYEKDMLVHISIKDKIYLFIMNNYQWLWSTLFVPFLIPWIKKKFKKSNI